MKTSLNNSKKWTLLANQCLPSKASQLLASPKDTSNPNSTNQKILTLTIGQTSAIRIEALP
jgi:retron-type reverse transcriptase